MRTISTSSYCPISARSGGTTSSSTASTSSTAVSCEAKGLAYKFARFWALPSWGFLYRPFPLALESPFPHRESFQIGPRRQGSASRPGLLRADPKGWLFMREKGGGRAVWREGELLSV